MKERDQWKFALLSSLAQASMNLPYLLFSGLTEKQVGTIDFFLPVLIVYTVQRVCMVCLRGFGEIHNPYRIMKGGLLISLSGAICVLVSFVFKQLLPVGALLVGMGFAPFTSMYVPLCTCVGSRLPSAGRVKALGSILYLLLAVLLLFCRSRSFPVVQIIFLLYTSSVLLALCTLKMPDEMHKCKSFDSEKRKPVYFAHGVCVLVCLLVIRQYKYSGVSSMIYLAPVSVLIGLTVELCRRRKRRSFVLETYWVGAIKSFLLVFGLLYQASLSSNVKGIAVYLPLVLGSIVSGFLSKTLKKWLGKNLVGICMLLSVGFSCLLLLPSVAVTGVGIFFSSLFSSIAGFEAGKAYQADETHPEQERALAKNRVCCIGNILMQMVLFLFIFLTETYYTHRSLFPLDTLVEGDTAGCASLRMIGIVCCSMLLLMTVWMLRCAAREQAEPGSKSKACRG